MPPRLGCPVAAPQRTEGRDSDRVDRAALATRPALSTSRRRRPWTVLGTICGDSIGLLPRVSLSNVPGDGTRDMRGWTMLGVAHPLGACKVDRNSHSASMNLSTSLAPRQRWEWQSLRRRSDTLGASSAFCGFPRDRKAE